MKLSIPIVVASSLLATAAFAQTPPTDTETPQAPAERVAPSDVPATETPSVKPAPAPAEEATPAPSTEAAPAPTAEVKPNMGPTLSDDEAKEWINKVVYSSDDKNVGEIAAIERDSSGQVKELHADIGGFLGLGETRVRLMPDQFKFAGDRLILNVTSEAAKSLPKVEG